MRPAPLPESLQPEADAALEEIRPNLDAALLKANRDALLCLFAASPFAARLAQRHPDLLESSLQDPTPAALDLPDPETSDEADCMRVLRHARAREMLRIMARDINGVADVSESLRDLTAFADRAVTETAQWHRARMDDPSPTDEQGAALPFLVLGMGKLGGAELNFSSDIDLIFSYPDPASDREQAQSYFIRLGQLLIKTLDEVTADGFVFRVDMRLRPFGSSGSLALPFSSMETYYQQHGREWERYALIKARCLGAPSEAGSELLALLRPFVYRRSLDFQVLEELRSMKDKMEHHVRLDTLGDDLKHGPGGIREAEFIVQSTQLIFGGREPDLQQSHWMGALEAMQERGKLEESDISILREAYGFLRVVENRLQMMEDQQTHALPADALSRERLRFSMGYADWAEFLQALDSHRDRLHQEFTGLMRVETEQEKKPHAELEALLKSIESTEAHSETIPALEGILGKMGLADGAEPAKRLDALLQSPAWRLQQAGGRHYALALVPQMIEAAKAQESPATALNHLFDLLDNLLHHPSHLALLSENPPALILLAQLVGHSSWVRTQIMKSPDLLDELLSPSTLFEGRTLESLQQLLHIALPAEVLDLEQQMKALRQFQHSQVLQVAACNLVHTRMLSDVSDELTWIAETVTARAWDLVVRRQIDRYGQPGCVEDGARRAAEGAILAYGKFGGLELGFDSDLDLVFVHDSIGEEQTTDGEQSVHNEYFFTRVAQRFIHVLETLTADGTLYEVDPRLRPGGQSGQPVCSLRYYEEYLRDKAWLWEHQALVRARVVAGADSVREAFEKIRAQVLCVERDPKELQTKLVDMRKQMLEAHPPRRDRFHLKSDLGGITDLEFLVHYNVLLYAGRHPEIIAPTATVMILDRLAESGLLDGETVAFLRNCYFTYRDQIHLLNLQELPPHTPPDAFATERKRIRELWDDTFDQAP